MSRPAAISTTNQAILRMAEMRRERRDREMYRYTGTIEDDIGYDAGYDPDPDITRPITRYLRRPITLGNGLRSPMGRSQPRGVSVNRNLTQLPPLHYSSLFDYIHDQAPHLFTLEEQIRYYPSPALLKEFISLTEGLALDDLEPALAHIPSYQRKVKEFLGSLARPNACFIAAPDTAKDELITAPYLAFLERVKTEQDLTSVEAEAKRLIDQLQPYTASPAALQLMRLLIRIRIYAKVIQGLNQDEVPKDETESLLAEVTGYVLRGQGTDDEDDYDW